MIPVSSTTPCYFYPLTIFSKLHDFCIVLSWVLHVIYNESKQFFNYPFKIHVPVHPRIPGTLQQFDLIQTCWREDSG